MLNLPSGSYTTQSALEQDPDKYSNYTIPADFVGTGFLIAELKLRHTVSSGGTWTQIELVDLRGLLPALQAGGSLAQEVEFFDNVFRILDSSDPTKKIAFEASGISGSTTRTLTAPDASGTIALFAWNEETGTSANMAVNNGYVANNAGLVTLTLPDTAAFGSVIEVVGKGAGGWKIAQNAGETIHFGTSDTTTGVGGSLASTEQYDVVKLVCTVADTDWTVISSQGNITIV
jgi:hypothetical protein